MKITTKITLEIDGTRLEFTLEQLKMLHEEVRKLIHEPAIPYLPPYLPPYPVMPRSEPIITTTPNTSPPTYGPIITTTPNTSPPTYGPINTTTNQPVFGWTTTNT